MNRAAGVAWALFSCLAAAPPAPAAAGSELLANGGFEEVREEIDPWSGVDRDGALRVHSASYDILIEGYRPSSLDFGAAPAAGDLNGDGRTDLMVGDGAGFLWIYLDQGPGGAPRLGPGRIVPSFYGGALKLCLADWDGDGDLDAIAGNHYGYVFVVENRGDRAHPVFTTGMGKPRYIPYGMSHKGHELAPLAWGDETMLFGHFMAPWVADWTGDGVLDLLLGEGTYSANSIWLLEGQSGPRGPRFRARQRRYLAYGYGREHLVPAAADIDGDGRTELLVGDRTGGLGVYRVPSGPVALAQWEESDVQEGICIRDRDLAIAGLGKDNLVVPCPVDWDRDGIVDLVLGRADGAVLWARGCRGETGQIEFAQAEPVRAGRGAPVVLRAREWHYSLRGHCNSAFHPVVVPVSDVARAGAAQAGASGRCLQIAYAEGYAGFTWHSRDEGLFDGGWVEGARYFQTSFGPGIEPGTRYRLRFAACGEGIELGCGLARTDSTQAADVDRGTFRLSPEWRHYERLLAAPDAAGAPPARSALRLYFKGTAGRCWVDDVSLTRAGAEE